MAEACRSCGASIVWAVTGAARKPIPLDAEPVADGNIELVDGYAKTWGSSHTWPAGAQRYQSHFARLPAGSNVAPRPMNDLIALEASRPWIIWHLGRRRFLGTRCVVADCLVCHRRQALVFRSPRALFPKALSFAARHDH